MNASPSDDPRKYRLLAGMATTLLLDASAHFAGGDADMARAAAVEGLETLERLGRVYHSSSECQDTEGGLLSSFPIIGDNLVAARLGALTDAVAGCDVISSTSRNVLVADLRRLANRQPAAAASLLARSKAAARRIKAVTGQKVPR